MKTSIDYKKLFKIISTFAIKYRTFLTIGLVVAIFGFAVARINQLSDPQIDEDAVASAKSVQIDDETVESIRQLIVSDVQIDPQYNNRTNPFTE